MTLARSRAARLVHTCGQELRRTLTAAMQGSIHQGGLALAASIAALIQVRFAQAPNPNPTQISSGTCRTSLHSLCTAAVRIQSLVCPSLAPVQSLFSMQEPMDLMELPMARCCSPQNLTPPTLRMRVPGPLFAWAPQSGLFTVPAHQQRDHRATIYTLELQLRGFQALRSDVHAVQRDSAEPSLPGPWPSWFFAS